MKLCEIHTSEAGPLGTQIFDFKDSWNGTIGTNTLITSHVPEVWDHYEAIGQRVLLGAPK